MTFDTAAVKIASGRSKKAAKAAINYRQTQLGKHMQVGAIMERSLSSLESSFSLPMHTPRVKKNSSSQKRTYTTADVAAGDVVEPSQLSYIST